MSTNHGGPVKQKSISEIAVFLKRMIPETIPKTFTIKSIFLEIGSEEEIHKGILAYREFLIILFEKMILEGDKHFKLKKKPNNLTDYPFIYQITDLLADIGYNSVLNNGKTSLKVKSLPSFISYTDENGINKKARNSISKLIECMNFLKVCGFEFSGVNIDFKKKDLNENQSIDVIYPPNPEMLIGLKVLSIADYELRTKRYKNDNNHDNLLRCDYWLLKSAQTDVQEYLSDFLHPLPGPVQELALELHQLFLDSGMTCTENISTFEAHFAYSLIKNKNKVLSSKNIYQKRLWEFSLSTRDDYSFIVRPKKTDKYSEVIKGFPRLLQDKISKGYGCDRKLNNKPCQNGCRGICLPLDDSILSLGKDIKVWLNQELK